MSAFSQIDNLSDDAPHASFRAIERDINAGYDRFWAKRGGDPEGSGNWFERSRRNLAHKQQQKLMAGLDDGSVTLAQILSQ